MKSFKTTLKETCFYLFLHAYYVVVWLLPSQYKNFHPTVSRPSLSACALWHTNFTVDKIF